MNKKSLVRKLYCMKTRSELMVRARSAEMDARTAIRFEASIIISESIYRTPLFSPRSVLTSCFR
jgi:hypothetical protein